MDLSHPLEQISERGLLPKCPFPGPVDLPWSAGLLFVPPQHQGWGQILVLGWATVPQGKTMPDLFALAMPWWEFILRAVVVYVVVLGMVRLGGKRALGQITPFDVLLIVLLGNAVQNALLGTDTSLGGGLLLAATLILLNYGVGWLTTRNRRMERMIEGEPTVIARDGRLLEGVLRRELISRADFDAALRQQGGLRIEDVQIALLETTGHITILPRKGT